MIQVSRADFVYLDALWRSETANICLGEHDMSEGSVIAEFTGRNPLPKASLKIPLEIH